MKIEKTKSALIDYLNTSPAVRWGLFSLIVIVFSLMLYPNISFTRYDYRLGDVADRDIKAPHEFLVEDRNATEKKQAETTASILTVYDHNAELLNSITRNVQNSFAEMRAAAEGEVRQESEAGSEAPENAENGTPIPKAARERTPEDMLWEMKDSFEKVLGIPVSRGAYRILMQEKFSPKISGLILKIISGILENGVVANKELLLREENRGIVLRTIGTEDERVIQNLKRFFGLDQAKTMVRILGQPVLKDLNYTLINLVVDLSQQLIQPNITLNRSETEKRKKMAAEAIKPIFYKIKAGEMLLREGERVTDVQLVKLKALSREGRMEQRYIRVAGMELLIVGLMIITGFLLARQRRGNFLETNKEVLFISVVLIIYFLLPGVSKTLLESIVRNVRFSIADTSMIYGIPLASGAMTICLFMGFEVAVSFALMISVCTAVIFHNRFEVFIYFFAHSIMAAYWLQSCRERKSFIYAGFKIAILNLWLATGVSIYLGELGWSQMAWSLCFAFLGGIGSGIIAAGVVPLLEMAFNYRTDITLLELANLERPILRRLMMEAPGTYHHSVIVGSMVEAAAAEIGANPLLAKVCGYYHDIGKINKPLYFIENQTDGINRHDKLAPSMSSLILISHVKEGMEVARKHKLGQEIIDTIRQHHGTSLIRYFYEKARKLKGEDAVKVDDFRYPGPRPQTREIALVMLADVVEAASRTLDNPTPSRIQGLVQNLINKIFSDGQLDNCELTLRDLHKIAKSFNTILNGIHHHRIEYPEKNVVKPMKNGKDRDDGSDQKQPNPPPNGRRGDKAESENRLKRLGVS